MEETHEVRLAIYDLSQGMARSLSAQFLGPNHAIDIIPHTGILAFGREYYFGGTGIEASDPHIFRSTRGLFPIEIQTLGRTSVSKSQFEAWCRQHMESGLFTSTSYDLFHRNCNNFSHHAATDGLKLPKGAPEWILGVPQKVLSSPMGQMLSPILQNMQVAGPSGNEGGNGSEFGNNVRYSDSHSSKKIRYSDSNSSNVAAQNNPWANLPSASISIGTSTNGNVASQSQQPVAASPPPKTPLLDSYKRPLLSNDSKMVSLCISKIKKGNAIKSFETKERDQFLRALEVLPKLLDNDSATASSITPSARLTILKNQMSSLLSILEKDCASNTEKTFTLMLIRLLVLQPDLDGNSLQQTIRAVSAFTSNQIQAPAALRSMALCVQSNAIGSAKAKCLNAELLDKMIDVGMMNASLNEPVEVRRGAAALIYNIVLVLVQSAQDLGVSVTDSYVTILCSVVENLLDEKDVVAATRILLIIGKIIKDGDSHEGTDSEKNGGFNTTAASLLIDLGYMDAFKAVANGDVIPKDKSKDVADLANEIVQIFSFVNSC